MEAFMEEFEDLKIQLKEITSATNNFHKDNLIGKGGFGMVYKGELSRFKERGKVAFKRLDRQHGQGASEFLREITMLSFYRHANLISLLGFCSEGEEMILAYEHASNGSLDNHLESPSLTWTRRLKICLQAAEGLRYLHDPNGTHQRVIHRDIKSANILLDEEWNAKVSDFGLSKMGPANEQRSYVVTNATGTLGYCDPMYMPTYTLTKESDVYSFGVVLFEVLCGKLCYKHSNGQLQVFVSKWKEQYKQHKLEEIIFHDLKQQMVATSLEIFTDIAYQCLRKSRKQRPTMSRVVEKLDIALQVQEATAVWSYSREYDYEEKPQEPVNEMPQEKQELLIKCIRQDLGFSSGKPVAACFIYKSLLHWRSFEVDGTTIFDRIIQAITLATQVQDGNHVLNYWLCNTFTLLTLLKRAFKETPQRPQKSSSTSLFGRMSQKLRASRSADRTDGFRQLQAKYPAFSFKKQLTELLLKIYGMILDNLKKELSPYIGLCILAPKTSRETLVKSPPHANAVARQTSIAHWQCIVNNIENHFETMKTNSVTPFLMREVFTQIFSFINVKLFNSLLLRRECCTFSNANYVQAGLAVLEQWCWNALEEYGGVAWDELKHIRQAVELLVTHQKPKITLKKLTKELCPVLNIHQLYRISTMYRDDIYDTHTISSEVISRMKYMMTDDMDNGVSSSLMLENDSSIHINLDVISKSMPQVDIGDIEFPKLIRENSCFAFLLE